MTGNKNIPRPLVFVGKWMTTAMECAGIVLAVGLLAPYWQAAVVATLVSGVLFLMRWYINNLAGNITWKIWGLLLIAIIMLALGTIGMKNHPLAQYTVMLSGLAALISRLSHRIRHPNQ